MPDCSRSCIDCSRVGCTGREKNYPDFCLTTQLDQEDVSHSVDQMRDAENARCLDAASEVIRLGKCHVTRVEETILFARQFHAQRIGIATCTALINESRILARILRANDFEVYGVSCKVGAVSRAELGLGKEYCVLGPNTCNPILQAKMLNEAGTDFNIIMGLCVGHDMIFQKHSNAPCTTLVAKDRVTGHNPAVPLYTSHTAYKYLLEKYVCPGS